ncbi:MAG: dihydroorotate dehydrogenase-like protein [Sandaracinaceae bacterium]
MDLSTTYLGLPLAHPFMPGASPLVDDLDTVRRLEDAGASAIVMHSLFEEQVTLAFERTLHDLEAHTESFAEARTFFPQPSEFRLAPDAYLEQIRRIRAAVSVPVIASLNGVTPTGWLEHAKLIEQAGAHALELNVYHVATDPAETGTSVEKRTLDILAAVRASVRIPIAIKLSPFYSSLSHFAAELEAQGASGLVVFNRFYQPDIDVEHLEVSHDLHLSDGSELLLRLRWLAILSAARKLDLAVSGGVHEPVHAIKALMAGATTVQMVSSLLRHGPGHLRTILDGARQWMIEHEYESLAQLRGSMNLARCPDPQVFERGNYLKLLQGWRPPR